jgi:hypothetical protein
MSRAERQDTAERRVFNSKKSLQLNRGFRLCSHDWKQLRGGKKRKEQTGKFITAFTVRFFDSGLFPDAIAFRSVLPEQSSASVERAC